MSSGRVIVIGGDGLGRGDQRLGSALTVSFLRALVRREEEPPAALIFLNSGVRLLIDGSAALPHLQELEARGVTILAERASVQHFDLEDKLEVGDSRPLAELTDDLLAAEVLSL